MEKSSHKRNNEYNFDTFNKNNRNKPNNDKYLEKKRKSDNNFEDFYNINTEKKYDEYKKNNYINYSHHKDNIYYENRKEIDLNNEIENERKNEENYREKEENGRNIGLPIFSKKAEILEKINNNRVVIISGNTGCGKSTQVPQFIYETSHQNKILITQPRRIAAISIANRLSFERKTKIGELIGYHVSMITNYSSQTKIFVKTTGVFLEELLHNNDDNDNFDYSHIIIDEVHERDLYVDLVLVLLKNFFQKKSKFE